MAEIVNNIAAIINPYLLPIAEETDQPNAPTIIQPNKALEIKKPLIELAIVSVNSPDWFQN